MVVWLGVLLVGWFNGCLIGWSIDWLTGGWLVG